MTETRIAGLARSVSPGQRLEKSVFRGNTYYFLLGDCKAEFDRALENFAKK